MKPTRDALLERFRQAFPEAAIQVEGESHLHVGHAGATGGAGHFRVRVIDVRFNELQRIARHRLVYDAVSDWMPERVPLMGCVGYLTLWELKAIDFTQLRSGPNRVGPSGLQIMRLGWNIFIPVTLVWLVAGGPGSRPPGISRSKPELP